MLEFLRADQDHICERNLAYRTSYLVGVPAANLRGYDPVTADYSTQGCSELNSEVNGAAITQEGGTDCRKGPTTHRIGVTKGHSYRRVTR